jgi:hypothetical protein
VSGEGTNERETIMAERTATYKGHTYKLAYLGPTKFGRKAKLVRGDGGEFWVPEHMVTVSDSGTAPTGTAKASAARRVCADCGKGGRLVRDMEDGLYKHFGCCDMPPGG